MALLVIELLVIRLFVFCKHLDFNVLQSIYNLITYYWTWLLNPLGFTRFSVGIPVGVGEMNALLIYWYEFHFF